MEECEVVLGKNYGHSSSDWINSVSRLIFPSLPSIWRKEEYGLYNETQWKCTNKSGILGHSHYEILLGPRDCQALKQRAYEKYGLVPWSPINEGQIFYWRKPPKKLLLLQRRMGRRIENLGQVKEMIIDRNVTFDLWNGSLEL